MKKILRVSDSFEEKYKSDLKNAEKIVPGMQVDFAFLGDIFYDIDGKMKFSSSEHNNAFEDYDLYWIGHRKAEDFSKCVRYFLYLQNKKIVNAGNNFSHSGKAGGAIYFHKNNIKTPKTLFFMNMKTGENDRIFQNINIVEERFEYPVIAKYSNMSRGEGVFLLKNRGEFENFLKETPEFETIIIQEFIENKGDFRIIVTKKNFIGAIKRYNESDFKNNVSAGGISENVAEISEEIKTLSLKIANDMNIDIVGIDYFIDKNDYKIIEVNPGPQYNGFQMATGIDVCVELLKYFKEL